jgi:PST family polysaccharide transporter
MDFRSLFWADVLSYCGGYALAGIVLAMYGLGVWALAWACLIQTFLKTCLTIYLVGQPVKFGFSLVEAKSLFAFGSGMSATRFLLYTARNLDYLVVGRFLGAEALGLYTRAFQLMVLPIFHFSGVLNAVLFPAYAEIQAEQERLRRVFLSNIRVVATIVFPLLAGMAAVAPELVTLLFGLRWVAMIPVLQVLCIGGFFLTIHNVGDSLACAKGAIRERFQRHLVYAVAVWGMTCYGIQWGPVGAAAGVVVALALQYLLMAQLCLQLVGASWKAFWSAQGLGVAFALLVTLTAQITVLSLRRCGASDSVVLLASVTSSSVACVLLAFRIPRVWLPSVFHAAMNRLEGHLRVLASRRDRNIPELEKGIS